MSPVNDNYCPKGEEESTVAADKKYSDSLKEYSFKFGP